jgi:hypothetical protein
MIEIAIALFFITFLLELVGRRFLSVALMMAGLIVYLGVLVYYSINRIQLSSLPMLLPSIYVCGIAWIWGVMSGSLLRLARSGPTQLVLNSSTDNWLGLVTAIALSLVGAFQLGMALATNSDMDYASKPADMLSMYNQSIEAAYAGIFWLSLAGDQLVAFLLKPALKQRGILFPSALFVSWRHVKSSEWKNNQLIVYLNHFSIWPRQVSLGVKPGQRESVNQLLAQNPLAQKSQPSAPTEPAV